MRYYYKKEKGSELRNLSKPCEEEGFIRITKKEYEELAKREKEEK